MNFHFVAHTENKLQLCFIDYYQMTTTATATNEIITKQKCLCDSTTMKNCDGAYNVVI